MEENNNSLIKVEEFNSIMATAPSILTANQTSVSKCTQAGKYLLDTIEASGGIDNDDLDADVAEYIKKSKVTVDNMNKRRKGLTQLLTMVTKSFTSLESAIDAKNTASPAYALQIARNKYAAKKLLEQKKREEEARRVQQLEQEKASYKADVELLLDTAYAQYIERHINGMTSIFNYASLQSYDDVCRQIKEASTSFVWADFAKNVKDNIQTFFIDGSTREGIKKVVAADKKRDYAERYRFEIEDLKQSLIDKLPSLNKSLREAEELRRTNAEEAARVEAERKAKEDAERKRLAELRKAQEEEARSKAEAQKAAAEVQSAFDFNASVMPTPTKAKVKKKIKVTNPQGYMQVYQMWFLREGINMSMEDLEKVHKKMITFCEKLMNKDGEAISSNFVRYDDDVTAK